ncbi:peptidylprolyl isomerase [Photobacterium ganghwense]|uniref:Periplasmic chaperone PpiD n=1 Tax=Photobacterium ganghwense TaxID=320778 RepID=A0A0J1GZB6_9GAMM|nr:peptidylprolyl isomerase [Photobacterium ganghwense]KLV04963.1 peptidylprolyl isomerase [Photobacterium ganghwense]PSU11164.1 peptidylprolyl isomerase [Photobacterium ganghwense]QSV13292.1 peptidylprolyl isomerase [Photobacterium ganghwense]
MMERMREGANSIWVKIILGLIILSFVFAGVGSYLAGSGNQFAAKVDGQEISQREFETAYQNERNRMQSQLGDYFSTLMGDPAYVQQFRRNVLDRMVNDLLIQQRAEELGMRISDTQVRQTILSMPEFQRDGAFDNEQYNMLLRRAGMTPDMFAESMRTDLLRQQFLIAIQGSDFALSNELTALTKLEQQQRDIRTLTLNVAEFTKNVDVSDDEAKAFYEQNPQMYMRPDQVKAAYIELSGDNLKNTLTVSDEDAKAYYEEHKSKFGTAEQRLARHILVQGKGSEAKAKAEQLLAQLKSGADFAELAKTSSDDTFSGQEGGKLDWFERGVMDPAFEEAAFALQKGDISDVVESDFGYHIIKLDDIKAPQVKAFADVRDEILAEVREQRAAEAFYDLQTALAEKAFEMPDSLEDAAEAVNAKVQTTDFISQSDAPGVLANPAVLQALFSPEVREDGLNSDVIEVGPEHIVVVRVNDSRDEMVLPFEDVSEKVKQQLAVQKGEEQAQAKADALLASLRDGKTEMLAEDGLAFSASKTISRMGEDRMIAQEAFALAKPQDGKSVYGVTRDAEGNILLIALDKVIEADVSSVATDNQLATQLEQMLAQQDVMATLQVLRDTSEVSYSAVDSTAN